MIFSRQRKESYLLSVIDTMKFVETFSDNRYVTNFLLFIELCISVQTSMLLTFFEQVRCGVKLCCITNPLPIRDWIEKSAYNDRSTHFLLVV